MRAAVKREGWAIGFAPPGDVEEVLLWRAEELVELRLREGREALFLINSFRIIRKQNGIPVEGNSKLRIVTEVDLRGQNCGSCNVRIQCAADIHRVSRQK